MITAGFQSVQGIISKIAYAHNKEISDLALWVYGKLSTFQKRTVQR